MSKFTTAIDARGPNGNIFYVMGACENLMKQLKVPQNEIADMHNRVMDAEGYDRALAVIEEWFPVKTDQP